MSFSGTFQQGDGNDDAHDRTDGAGYSSTSTNVILDNSGGATQFWGAIRLPNVTIPARATILTAVLRVTFTNTSFDSPHVNIYCEAIGNSPNFITNANVITRTVTSGNVSWDGVDLGTSEVTTPDVRVPLQELVNLTGWASGNALCFIIKGKNSGAAETGRLNSYNNASTPTVFLDVTWDLWDNPNRLTRTAARGPAPGRASPATQPPDSLRDGKDRQVAVADPRFRPMFAGPAPGMFAPASFPPDRVREKMANVDLGPPASPPWPIFHPPGHLAPMTSIDNGIWTAAERVPTRRTYYITKSATASDNNGGTSLTIRSSGADGIVNVNAGATKVTSPTATWTQDDVGHVISVNSGALPVCRLINSVTPGRIITITTNGTSTITSVGSFTSAMIGQAVTGTNIAANTVISAVASANSATISLSASGSGTQDATLWPMATTTATANGTNTVFSIGTARTWVVGGAWATVVNAFSAANGSGGRQVIAGGDTIYLAPGIYREQLSPSLNVDNGIVSFIGDVDGSHTNTAGGEVRITGYTTDLGNNSTSTVFNIQAVPGNLSVSNIFFESAGNASALGIQPACHDLTFTNCAFGGAVGIACNVGIGAHRPANVTFERCIIHSYATALNITMDTSSLIGADYDANVVVRNCIITSMGGFGISGVPSGALAYKGGGIRIRNCTVLGGSTAISMQGSGTSSGIPCTVFDSIVAANNATITTGNFGQIFEDYNRVFGQALNNVVSGGHSSVDLFFGRLGLHWGQERIWGGIPRPFGSPTVDNQALVAGSSPTTNTWPGAPSPTTDMFGQQRPSGVGHLVASGTATSGTTTTLTDSTATWPANSSYNGATIKITGGVGAGQVKIIKSHTSTTITTFSDWVTPPTSTSTYTIYWGNPAEHFQVGTYTNSIPNCIITNINNTWSGSQWVGFTVEVVSGTGVGQTAAVLSSAATALTIKALATPLNATSMVKLYRQTDENSVVRLAGAMERHDTALAETTLTDAGGIAWQIPGWGDQTLRIPVDATATTISIKCSFDTDHGNTNKPTLSIVAAPELGVSAQTVTALGTAGSGTFETLTLSTFTPTGKGWVEIRVAARSNLPTGRAVFDTVSVS